MSGWKYILIMWEFIHSRWFDVFSFNVSVFHALIRFIPISALTVRFLTKRYIGEYDHQTGNVHWILINLLIAYLIFPENRHKYEIMVDAEAILFEIWDTCPKVSG